jgi:hypothetical protein
LTHVALEHRRTALSRIDSARPHQQQLAQLAQNRIGRVMASPPLTTSVM